LPDPQAEVSREKKVVKKGLYGSEQTETGKKVNGRKLAEIRRPGKPVPRRPANAKMPRSARSRKTQKWYRSKKEIATSHARGGVV